MALDVHEGRASYLTTRLHSARAQWNRGMDQRKLAARTKRSSLSLRTDDSADRKGELDCLEDYTLRRGRKPIDGCHQLQRQPERTSTWTRIEPEMIIVH